MSAVFDMTAKRHDSKVLAAYISDRGAQSRIAPRAMFGENATSADMTSDQLAAFLGATATTASGSVVTPQTALRVSAVYACVSLIAGAISMLPLEVYERMPDGEQKIVTDHPYWWLMNESANENLTASSAWEWLIASKLFYGDGFAKLIRAGYRSSQVIGWKPLHSMAVEPFRDPDDMDRVLYRVTEFGKMTVYDSADIIHIPSLGFDGLRSPSPITYAAREAIGTSLSAETYTSKFFNGGATFDFALQTDAKLSKQQLDDLYSSLRVRLSQGGRAPLILSGGLEAAQISVNPKDAEILATRMFGVEELCRILGVPPHMVGHTDKSTSWGSGIEQQGMGFVRYTLMRHMTPVAQEFNRKLWPSRSKYFVEHNTEALVRGDLKARFEAYRVALGRAGEQPWMSAQEIRRREKLPPSVDLQQNTGAANA